MTDTFIHLVKKYDKILKVSNDLFHQVSTNTSITIYGMNVTIFIISARKTLLFVERFSSYAQVFIYIIETQLAHSFPNVGLILKLCYHKIRS